MIVELVLYRSSRISSRSLRCFVANRMSVLFAVLAAVPLLEYRVTASKGAEVLDVEVRGPGLDAGLTLDAPVLHSEHESRPSVSEAGGSVGKS